MKCGDLVTLGHVTLDRHDHQIKSFRVYDRLIKENINSIPSQFITSVDKFNVEEIAIVLNVESDVENVLKAMIITPRGKIGWIDAEFLKIL